MEISFSELKEGINNGTYNDVNNPVWLGLLVKEEELPDMTNVFRDLGLIEQHDSVTGFRNITGNVLGDRGRHDVMLEISGNGIINPIARLMIEGLKWSSDFIVNYKDDYEED